MTINTNLISQLAIFDSILAGFLFSIAVRLITTQHQTRKKFMSFPITAFILSALSLIVATFVSVLILSAQTQIQAPLPSDSAGTLLFHARLFQWCSLSGLFLFIIGVILTSWIWETMWVSIVSTIFSLFSLGLILYAWNALP